MNNLQIRLISAFSFGIAFLFVLWIGSIPAAIMFGIISLLCAWEWANIMDSKSSLIALFANVIGVAFIISFPSIVEDHFLNSFNKIWCAALILIGLESLFFNSPRYYKSQFRIPFVFGISFGLLINYILNVPNYFPNLFIVFALIWASDSGAYFIGKAFGKNKLAPKISPGKTIEGLFGGLLLNMILAGILLVVFKLHWSILLLGFIIHFTSVIGDLFESKHKRIYNKKDSGNLIPGHGGFLDRLDGFIYSIPFVILYFQYITLL